MQISGSIMCFGTILCVASGFPIASLIGIAASSPVLAQKVNQTGIFGGYPPIAPDFVGSAVVKNTCSFPVYVQSVAGPKAGPVVALVPDQIYHEMFHSGPMNSGVAIKITKDVEDWSAPMLLEYGVNFVLKQIFYDMSVSVGGNQQGNGGIGNRYQLVPSITGPNGACTVVTFANSYTHLGESDYATKSCPISTTLTLDLC